MFFDQLQNMSPQLMQLLMQQSNSQQGGGASTPWSIMPPSHGEQSVYQPMAPPQQQSQQNQNPLSGLMAMLPMIMSFMA